MNIPGVLELIEPTADPLPILYSVPHAGREYPPDFGAALPMGILRRAEDAHVDELLAAAPGRGVRMLRALFPRAYLDVNRPEDDLDPALFAPGTPVTPGPKSRLGIGLLRRVVTPAHPIYDRLLTLDEARGRIARCYHPYHDALADALADLGAIHGAVCLVDWHSMKSMGNAATPDGEGARRPDFVIGDLGGASCDPALTRLVADTLAGQGYTVSVNNPYAGGHVLARHGRPGNGVHALQIEINRALYLDETAVSLTAGAAPLATDLDRLISPLAQWIRGRSP